MDISNLLRSNGVGLESQAHNVFGAAVDDYVAQGMNLARERIVPEPPEIPFSGSWTSSRYASDLVKYAPKHRFMFRVNFAFAPGYAGAVLDEGVKDPHAFNYLIKQIDKPTVVFQYEDVNFYNYRTKVLKGIEHQQITMTFYDDIGNNVFAFFDAYRKAFSPISRMNSNLAFPGVKDEELRGKGMDFTDPSNRRTWYAASVGPLANNAVTVLNSMTVYQIFGHGQFMNRFVFINPRIIQFDFDDMDHEGGNGNVLTVQLEYDALTTSTVTLTGRLTTGIPGGLPHEPRPTYTRAPGAGAGLLGPFGDRILGGLINVGTRSLGTNTSAAIQRTLGPGSGYIGYSAGSIISDTSRYTLHGASAGVSQPYAGTATPPLVDNSAYGRPAPIISSGGLF